jgi:pimeloyl-ACP methyl ester carboxylesterase
MEVIRRLMLDSPPAGVIGALEAMKGRTDSTAELVGYNFPTLVIVGQEDKPTPPDVAEEMCQALPSCRLVVLPTAGHLSNLEVPDEFTAELRAFLDRLS